ncbi:hypothetical protein [Streptomyces sp. CA-111067]|uniref:hypothetical protein n=1 Tax=Streptomyces sp. CA-111067 TaxID=3240046 RepID=UPI003D9559AF
MFLDATILAVIAARRWYAARHHNQQVEATHRTLAHLQAAYDQAAAAPLATLAQRTPPPPVTDHHVERVRQSIPTHAQQIVTDPAWPALATALTDAETAGHDPARLLRQAADQRALTDARSPAQVLVWRLQRLSARPAPSPRARAAQARSTFKVDRTPRPAEPTRSSSPEPPGRPPRHHR